MTTHSFHRQERGATRLRWVAFAAVGLSVVLVAGVLGAPPSNRSRSVGLLPTPGGSYRGPPSHPPVRSAPAPSPTPSPAPSPAPGPSAGTFSLNLTGVEWNLVSSGLSQVIGSSGGANISANGSLTRTVTVGCPITGVNCSTAHRIAVQGAESLGDWPPGVAPCGWYRLTFSVVASNLPAILPANGSVTITLTLQAPAHDAYASGSPDFDYTGILELYLSLA